MLDKFLGSKSGCLQLASKEVIKKGWRWRLGNGGRAKIWGDPWLADEHYPKILTPKAGSSLSEVRELVDLNRMGWNVPLIKQVFMERDVELILSTPLSMTGVEDKYIWMRTTSEIFSVKSAYVIAKEQVHLRRALESDRGQSSGDLEDEGRWKRVWNMKAPAKIKMFLWRCLHDIVPVNMALTQRKIDVDPICPLCGLAEETPSHMLFNCDRAIRVWLLSPFRFRPETSISAQLKNVWVELDTAASGVDRKEVTSLFATIGWHIWIARNFWVFKQSWIPETTIIERAVDEYNTFLQAVRKEKPMADIDPPATVSRWQPPEFGVLKVNVDGAFDAKTHKGGVGLVIRDYLGKVVGAAAALILCSMSAELVEAKGVRFALGSPTCSPEKAYVVEGDAQTVIKMLQDQSILKACSEVVIRDALFLANQFLSCSFHFVSRDCNKVANAIAKYALSLDGPLIWQEVVPNWISREASLDVSSLSLP